MVSPPLGEVPPDRRLPDRALEGPVQYRSVADLSRDVAEWADSLPRDIDVVAGIPRSGMLPASMLAVHLHVPLADLDGLLAGRLLSSGARMGGQRPSEVIDDARRILVVDDSVMYGGALDLARDKVRGHGLEGRIEFGAVYIADPGSPAKVDHWAAVVPNPRVFEWNVLHHSRLAEACMEIDGVLCRAPRAAESDGAAYEGFLRDVPARLVPAQEVGWLVTSRSERYRSQTERWLAGHGIKYRELVMSAEDPPGAGVPSSDRARHKADVYRRTQAWLFIEGDVEQAVGIATMARRPVFAADARQMIYPGVAAGAAPRRRDSLRWHLPSHAVRLRRRIGRTLRG
ncbi:phosphoribosyltransferase family protein [Aquipuribacter sp. MA13-6]|uniref:phosphoribosyltransferase n=1 Tax=unclassified Aquipuribacter TaxID=2635084 RepID=UPI003EEF0F19